MNRVPRSPAIDWAGAGTASRGSVRSRDVWLLAVTSTVLKAGSRLHRGDSYIAFKKLSSKGLAESAVDMSHWMQFANAQRLPPLLYAGGMRVI
ncbi:hypothetical protein MRX96_054981 [Rhipicephalus microplus]